MRYFINVTYRLKYLVAFYMCWQTPVPVTAQTSKIIHNEFVKVARLEGLRVRSILRDTYGFMWFGTETGLYRYDGYNTELIKSSSPGIHLASDLVLALYEDRQKNLWIGTGNGIQQLSRDRKSIKPLWLPPIQQQNQERQFTLLLK